MTTGWIRQRTSPRSSNAAVPNKHRNTDSDIEQQYHDRHNVLPLQDSQHSKVHPRQPHSRQGVYAFLFSSLCVVFFGSNFVPLNHRRAFSADLQTSSSLPLRINKLPNRLSPSTKASVSERPSHNKIKDTKDRELQECGIWMAPSSLRPNPGFGIFTTRDISNQESILHQPDAVSIPLHDMRRRKDMPLAEERRKMWMNLFGNVSRGRCSTLIPVPSGGSFAEFTTNCSQTLSTNCRSPGTSC